MVEGQGKMLQTPVLAYVPQEEKRDAKHKDQWLIMETDGDENMDNASSLDHSCTSDGSASSSDLVDDASSPTSTLPSSSNSNNSPLFEFSELMAHLPIKRGLSKYYQGKSQSFTSLSRVISIEDLPKKESPYKRKMKASKSYGNGLDGHKPYTLPKPIISKKVTRRSLSSLSLSGRRGGSFPNSSRPPPAPAQK